ncbi:MAG TPA: alpha/beta fold hydrolase [Oligoflexia bacterium]|nr:alpha/beta fold hydrolase [Oligoflexia bacterium]HMR23893.1 alpha/beta fold hydrolase [Oligoflexia bacterium]
MLAHPHPLHGGSLNNKVIDQLFKKFNGYAALRFNFRGVGESSGQYDQGFGELDDLMAVIDYSLKTFDCQLENIVLCGYSFGSWIAWQLTTAHNWKLKALHLIAPPALKYPFNASIPQATNVYIWSAEKDELIDHQNTLDWVEQLRNDAGKKIQHTTIKEADHYFIGKTVSLIDQVLAVLNT